MKKIILSLLILSIALIGISAAAASDVDDLEDKSVQSESPDVSGFNKGYLDDILNDIISQIKETQDNSSSYPPCDHPPYELADDGSSDSNNSTYDGNCSGSDVVNNYEPDNSGDVVGFNISKNVPAP